MVPCKKKNCEFFHVIVFSCFHVFFMHCTSLENTRKHENMKLRAIVCNSPKRCKHKLITKQILGLYSDWTCIQQGAIHFHKKSNNGYLDIGNIWIPSFLMSVIQMPWIWDCYSALNIEQESPAQSSLLLWCHLNTGNIWNILILDISEWQTQPHDLETGLDPIFGILLH